SLVGSCRGMAIAQGISTSFALHRANGTTATEKVLVLLENTAARPSWRQPATFPPSLPLGSRTKGATTKHMLPLRPLLHRSKALQTGSRGLKGTRRSRRPPDAQLSAPGVHLPKPKATG